MNYCLSKYGLDPQQLLNKLYAFVDRAEQLAEDIGIDVTDFQADHIAIRINHIELTRQVHKAWLEYGNEISSARINGRPIIVIHLDPPLQLEHRQIECLELPYPAQGKLYPQQGWEHIEFVIPSEAQTTQEYLEELKRQFPRLAQRWHQLNEIGIKAKLSMPKGEGERLANPTIAFKRDEICVKFHPCSLKEVIASEKQGDD